MEAILVIMLLVTLAFLALPVYNSCTLYRQSKLKVEGQGSGQTAPEVEPKALDANVSKTVPNDSEVNPSKVSN
ncbi:MAG: hypothetical protein VCA36_11335 [Opitutales bacterium]